MELNLNKNDIQEQALRVWLNSDKKCTAEMITGSGKTFLALKALYTMPKHQQDVVHLFLAEQRDRELDLNNQIKEFNRLNNCDVLKDYNLKFECYQTVCKWKNFKFGLIIADEIHDSLSPSRCSFYIKNKFDAVLGLSAKISEKIYYDLSLLPELKSFFKKSFINKIEMLEKIAPIKFSYTINRGQLENTSRKLKFYIVENKLDTVSKNIPAGNIKNRFYQTEEQAYKYLDNMFQTALTMIPYQDEDFYKFEERKNIEITVRAFKRSAFIYELPSKFKSCKRILDAIKGKTIIFGNSIETLQKITPNVVASKFSEDYNRQLREDFDNNIIKTIASFKKLKQGANLKEVDNCIIHSYYSTDIDLIQRIGRLRQNGNKIGNVIILVTKNTQEEKWLNTMLKDITEYEIIRCSEEECIKKLKNDQ